ncbi:MAG: AraC family transcriptional regulator [Bacteroidota bacterium]
MNWIMIALGLSALGVLLIWFYKKPPLGHSGKKNMDEEELKIIYKKVIELLNDQQFFLNKSLKVSDLAIELGSNERLVSKAINLYGAGNFNKFINAFRVEHSKELLSGGKYDFYTIEAIAEESGFSNKVSFYNSFKSHVGMSPSQFKKLKQVKS